MSATNYQDLINHFGHRIEVVTYGEDETKEGALNVAVECVDCCEVLMDFDKED